MAKVERNYQELVEICDKTFFESTRFMGWLNEQARNHEIATWHKPGEEPGEYSDIFTYVDMCEDHAEGSDSDMPEECWDRLISHLRGAGITSGSVIVWLKNM